MKELKKYKQELVAITLISVVLLLVRWLGRTYWPTTGQYDLTAETETVVWTLLRLVIYCLAAWAILWASSRKAYRYLKNTADADFDKMDDKNKLIFSSSWFAVLLLSLVMLAMSACNTASAAAPSRQRECVVSTAEDAVGIREATGHNDGKEVEEYLAYVGLKKGSPGALHSSVTICQHVACATLPRVGPLRFPGFPHGYGRPVRRPACPCLAMCSVSTSRTLAVWAMWVSLPAVTASTSPRWKETRATPVAAMATVCTRAAGN